jgi:hypothetical protein
MFSREYKMIFIHIPRTGGTSMAYSLKTLSSTFKYPQWNHFNYIQYKIHLSQRFNENIDNYFVFTIIRNPWDRVVSHYEWHTSGSISDDKKYYDSGIKIKPRGRPIIQKKKRVPFDQYVLSMKKIYTPFEKQTQYDYLKGPGNKLYIDFIIQYETLNEGLDCLRNKKKINLDFPHIHKTDHKHYSEYFQNDLTLINAVRDYFKRDIDYFGYTYEWN